MNETRLNPTELGEAVCRKLLRGMPDAALVLNVYGGAPEWTPAAEQRMFGQWVVALNPTLDFVSVVPKGQLETAWGPYKEIDFGGNNPLTPASELVHYPADRQDITGEAYAALLRDAVERAVQAVEADYAAALKRSGR